MIEEVRVATLGTYGSEPELLSELSTFNYLFGANASGKTTISRIINDEAAYPTCSVRWKGGTKLQPMVYNRDFVERNLSELKGVFTLGEESTILLMQIQEAKAALDEQTRTIESLAHTLSGGDGTGGKRGDLQALEAEFRDTCWAQKQKHDPKLKGAFEGYRSNTERFRDKLLKEAESNSADLMPLDDLVARAGALFDQSPSKAEPIPEIDAAAVLTHEKSPILAQRIVGKEDVDIARMIERLGNSDWVRQGLGYFEGNDGFCPFCQQSTTEAFRASISEYFDESFDAGTKAIETLRVSYGAAAERLQRQLDSLLGAPNTFLAMEKLQAWKKLLDSKIAANIQWLTVKGQEPSRKVEMDSLAELTSWIQAEVSAANSKILAHNTMVENLTQERRNLTNQVWKFLLEVELKDSLASFKQKHTDLSKAIQAIETKISEAQTAKEAKTAEIRALEEKITSPQPTVDRINDILRSFGFSSFALAMAPDGAHYRLVRPDGTDVGETLSEGERSFLAFLYFFHLLQGSTAEAGITTDRIVVFDDPVSSLDSEVLFIVSTLIRRLFEEIRSGESRVKQAFVLTHNVYFHKEVTFSTRRHDGVLKEETFWIVRKPGGHSKIERQSSNPIRTGYQLLWAELKRKDHSSVTIQNAMRRILENYFKISGDLDPDSICGQFDGRDKLLVKSLLSWVHAGSHDAHDDLFFSSSDATVERFLMVFEGIFEKSGHHAHHEMMMGSA